MSREFSHRVISKRMSPHQALVKPVALDFDNSYLCYVRVRRIDQDVVFMFNYCRRDAEQETPI